MAKATDYCKVEFDFLTGGTNETLLRLTVAQRYAYLSCWSYAVHLRKLILSRYEIEYRVSAIYDIDRRTVTKMLQECSKDVDLLREVEGGYEVVGVDIKHAMLGDWKTVNTEQIKNGDRHRTGEDSTVHNSTGKEAEIPIPESDEPKIGKPPRKEIEAFWNGLCQQSGLTSMQEWSKERSIMLNARWKDTWFRDNWQGIFREVHKNEWCREKKIDITHALRPKNALRYYEAMARRGSKIASKGFDITVRFSDGSPPEMYHMKDDQQLQETIERMGLHEIDKARREYEIDVEQFNRRKEQA